MATKSSIHIKPCNIASSEAHNRRTAEYMRHIGESRIYVVPELSTDNEQWINPDFGSPDLRMHYDNIRQMVKEKTGRAMQEKERERKGKNGKIVKIAGCSPIREGVLLVRSDTTLADVRKFGEECQRRWGITPLQIFLHKDEGHWLNGQPEAEDRESFKVGDRWFKPNYHAHIVFDWMNHETGKSRKLNDDDMMQMQTLASDILLMERGQSKAVTGKEHLERNDFIIEKQKAELQRMDAAKRHKEEQINLAEQELKQVKSEIRTDKLKKTATTAATAITSGVASLFGSGKLKELERANEKLQDEVSKRTGFSQVPQKARFQLLFVQRRLQIDDKLVTVLFIIPQMGAGRQDHRPGHAPVGKKHFSEVAVDRLFLLILDGQGHIAQGKALHRAAARVSAHQGDQGSLRRDDRVARFRGDPVAVAGGAGGWIRHAAGSQDDAAAGIG